MKIKMSLVLAGLTLLLSVNVVRAEYSTNIIPVMTSNSAPSGVVSASSSFSTAWSAFDHIAAAWVSTPGAPQWLEYRFTDSSKRVVKYSITSNGNAVNMAPKAWEFQGNSGGIWTTIDTRSDVLFSDFQTQEFVVANPERYGSYRLNVTEIADNSFGVGISEIEMFIDTSYVVSAPTVATVAASNITQTSATVNAELLDAGGEASDRRISQWINAPADENLWNIDGPVPVGLAGTYSAEMTDLTPGTTYYFQAYAVNSAGTSYGEILSFTTEFPPAPPTVVTNAVSAITSTSAIANINITSAGGDNPEITAGWGLSAIDFSCDAGTGPAGLYSCNMTGLTPSTTYMVKASATNNMGTTDGDVVYFTTLPAPIVTSEANSEKSEGKNLKIYKKYKRIHNVAVHKSTYVQVKKIKKTNPTELERLKALYAKYRVSGSREIAKLDKKTQADFKFYKKYRIYKQYLFLKDKAGE